MVCNSSTHHTLVVQMTEKEQVSRSLKTVCHVQEYPIHICTVRDKEKFTFSMEVLGCTTQQSMDACTVQHGLSMLDPHG